MKLAVIVLFIIKLCTFTHADTYIDELLNDNENAENTVVSSSNDIVKRDTGENNEPQVYHIPQPSNMIETDDLMAQASPASVSIKQNDDLMSMRDKREAKGEKKQETTTKKDSTPTFKRIYDFITSHDMMSPISNERNNELTAKSTSRIEKREDSHGEMSTILSGIQSTKHHKLTRSDIRKLAKKAVMLATLKKLNEVKSKKDAKKSTIATEPKNSSTNQSHDKTTEKKSKSSKKTKKSKKSTKKSKSEKIKPTLSVSGKEEKPEKNMDNIGDTLNMKESKNKAVENFENMLKDTTNETPTSKMSEMSEDLSGENKKKTNIENLLSDDTMEENKPDVGTLTTSKKSPDDGLDDLFETDKKSNIEKPTEDKKVENMLLGDTTTNDSQTSEDVLLTDTTVTPTKKSVLPNNKLNEQIASLKFALSKSSPNKVPEKFFPDLPAGIRMIAWKKLLVKKTKELEQLQSVNGVDASASAETSDNKPVMINIDIDQDKTEKDAMAALAKKDIETKTEAADDKTASHVHYLQKHIKGARALRKLIAKTLIGHCKTTGKRILRAFVAMDKALARAQAIANVIGSKFKIDSERIDALVGDKEDQVVETFLRDIFTKI